MRTRKEFAVFVLVVNILIALALDACRPAIGSLGDTNIVSSDKTAVLKALGVDTAPGARKNTNGTAMADSDNPFGREVVNLKKTEEVFVISADNVAQLINPVLTTPASNPPLASPTFETVGHSALNDSSGLIKRPVAADLDGDGKEEIVTAVFAPSASPKTISFYEIASGSSYNMVPKGSIPWKTSRSSVDYRDFYAAGGTSFLGVTRDWNHCIDLSSGDLDGDGKDEIALVSDATLYVLDHSLLLIMQTDIPALTGATTQILRVKCADLDGDGRAEIVLSNGTYDGYKTAQISVYKLDGSSLSQLLGGPVSATAASTSIRSAEIAIGDVDGDKLPEIVLAGLKNDAGQNETMVMHLATTSGVLQATFLNVVMADDLNSNTQNWWSGWMPARDADAAVPILAVGDLDGDGKAEIVAGDDVLELTYAAATGAYSLDYAYDSTSNEVLRRNLGGEYLPGWGGIWGVRAPDTAYFNQVRVGDLNGDGKDEIVVLDYMRNKLRQYYYSATSSNIVKGPDQAITGGSCAYLCLADVDVEANSPVVRYKGHTLIFSDPFIVGVISGPPIWNKVDSQGNPIQDTNNVQTTLTFSAGASIGVGATVGFSVGVTAGEKAEVPVVSNGEETVKLTVTTGYTASFKAEVSGSVEYTYLCPSGTDKVIFTSVPIDVYEYEDVADSSKKYFVKEQRKPGLQYVDVSFYNANNGDYPDIDAAALRNHVIGNPYSYPTLTQATDLFNALPGFCYIIKQALKNSSWVTPGTLEGNGVFDIKYSAQGSVGAEFTQSMEVKVEQEASFVAIEGSSFAANVSCSVSASLTGGTAVSGSVGGLAADYYVSGYRYNWGIFSYLQSPTVGNPYMVLNYWVDPI